MTGMKVPQHVTRFYGKTKFACDVLEKKRITFVRTSVLNDPFDPYWFFETDFGANYRNLIRHVKKHHPDDLAWFRTTVKQINWKNTVTALEDHLQKLRQTTVILSTSAALSDHHPKDNLYMWGHYGDGHRGVAIEFDTKALARAVRAHHKSQNGQEFEDSSIWAKIEYAKTFGPITAEDVYEFVKQPTGDAPRRMTRLNTYYSRMSTVKSEVWKAENEWRLMWRNDESGKTIYQCPIFDDCIAAIYLGLRLPPGEEKKLVFATRKNFRAVAIMKAAKRHGDLALDFHPV